MKRCVLIVPYFGSFPSYFQLFLDSCKQNSSFDWLILTDNQTDYDFPHNVTKIPMSFQALQQQFAQKLGFVPTLLRPYKLCDMKPAYGLVFSEYIQNYAYWGHCDVDLLFGDLTKLHALMDHGYAKIFAAGHLTLYQNTPQNNQRFLYPLQGENAFWRCANEEKNRGFDEAGGNPINVHCLYREHGFAMYEEDLSFNCSELYDLFHQSIYDPKQDRWMIQKRKKAAFFWREGKILALEVDKKNEIQQHEYLYMHFQGRKNMTVHQEGTADAIWICPHGFVQGVALPTNAKQCKKRMVRFGGMRQCKKMLFRCKLVLGRQKIRLLTWCGKRAKK